MAKDRHYTVRITHNLHPRHRCIDKSIQRHQCQDRGKGRRNITSRHINQPPMGGIRGNTRGRMVDIADHQIITVPHQHQRMNNLG